MEIMHILSNNVYIFLFIFLWVCAIIKPIQNQKGIEIMNENKYLYVIFSKTDTCIGKIIRMATRHEYNHVSLSFCPKLCKMFTFARYRKNSPLAGGFVCERVTRYLFPDRDAKVKICRLLIEDEEYQKLKQRMARFTKEGKKMRYNSFDALALPLGLDINIKNTYTCLDFVCESLGISVDSIVELENILEKYRIYEGSLAEYVKDYELRDLDYFDPISIPEIACDTVKHFTTLIKRLLD